MLRRFKQLALIVLTTCYLMVNLFAFGFLIRSDKQNDLIVTPGNGWIRHRLEANLYTDDLFCALQGQRMQLYYSEYCRVQNNGERFVLEGEIVYRRLGPVPASQGGGPQKLLQYSMTLF